MNNIFTKKSWLDYKEYCQEENNRKSKGIPWNAMIIPTVPTFEGYMDFCLEEKEIEEQSACDMSDLDKMDAKDDALEEVHEK